MGTDLRQWGPLSDVRPRPWHQAANSGPASAAGASHWSAEAAGRCDWPGAGVLLATQEMARYDTDPHHNDVTISL